MSEDLKQLRQGLIAFEKVLEEKKIIVAGFPKRQSAIVTQVADKRFELENCQRDRGDLVARVATGDASEMAVFEKTSEIGRVEREIEDLEGLLAGFPAARERLQKELKKCEQQVETCRRVFWENVIPLEKVKFPQSSRDIMLRCWSCHVLSGGPLSFAEWIKLHFGGYVSADFQVMKAAVEKEYFAKEVK